MRKDEEEKRRMRKNRRDEKGRGRMRKDEEG